ncbi:MAG: tRNA (adenosine(37)-N6)-threonylcarbamoyltransferase complex dimerization subunit type 1 TsaB [Steroidobacteraceae bacterium]
MNILALDTATESCSAALLLDGRLLQREQRLERGHADAILPMVDALLGEAGIALSALDAIAFGRGPGAFTGVRLAASVTQGLAFGARLPVVPVSDLQALAQRSRDEDRAIGRVLVCADARMREVYWACFERSSESIATAHGAERVGPPSAVRLPGDWGVRGSEASRPSPSGHLAGVGSGFAAYPELCTGLVLDAVRADLLPRAAEIARLALPAVAAGRFVAPEQALPVYLRDDVTRVTPRPS